jgi:hypothetical protein
MARTEILSHWCKLIENLQTSSLDFYVAIEQAIKKREVPETVTSRIEHQEGGIFSAKRQYLRVERKNLAFDICGAPFGTGFFVSSWLSKEAAKGGIFIFMGFLVACLILIAAFQFLFGFFMGVLLWIVFIPCLALLLGHLINDGKIGGEDAILATPVLGGLYNWLFHPMSYYKQDTIQMYQAAIHAAVTEVVDEITKAKGLHALTDLERKPIMKEFVAN